MAVVSKPVRAAKALLLGVGALIALKGTGSEPASSTAYTIGELLGMNGTVIAADASHVWIVVDGGAGGVAELFICEYEVHDTPTQSRCREIR